jgi:hypothetical protein
MYRMPGPHFSMASAMHHWHKGQPLRPYLWVLCWHVAHGPTWSPGQVRAEGGWLGDRWHGSRERGVPWSGRATSTGRLNCRIRPE